MRVLFAAHGAYGHVMPLLGVARSLVENGHDVVVATSPAFRPVVATTGLQPYPAGMDEAHWSPRPAGGGRTRRRYRQRLGPPGCSARSQLPPWPPTCARSWSGGGRMSWFERRGSTAAPWRGGPSCAVVTHAWGSPLQGEDSLVELGRLLSPMWKGFGLAAPAGPELYGAAIFDPCPPSLYVKAPAIAQRHGVRKTSRREMGERGPGKGARRHAYVGFGTVPLFRDDPLLTRAAIEPLVAAGFDVTVTTADGGLAGTIEQAHRTRVRIERWVELPELLKNCSVAVCHGGAGTVLSALAAGVPLVLLPRGAPSQQRTSEACEKRGVGRAVVWNGTNSDEIRAAITEVTSDERFVGAAASVAREMAAMPDPSIACAVIEGVVRAMG